MALKTVFNNILVKLIEDDSQIVVSEDVAHPERGVVVAIGGGTKDFPMQVREDMIVHFNKHDATKIEYEGETVYLLSQLDILAYEED